MQSKKQYWWGFIDLTWRLFARNIRSAHRRSVLGMLWLIIPLIVNTGVWVFLHTNGVIKYVGESNTPYLAFALTGIMFWQIFIDALELPFKLMEKFQEIIKNLSFNHFALMGASMLEVLFNVVIRIGMLMAFALFYGVDFRMTMILVILPLMTLLVLGFGLSMCIMPFYLMYRDVPRLLAFTIQFGFFITPIVYQMPKEGWFAEYGFLNPVTSPILLARDLFLQGHSEHWMGVGIISVIATLLFIFGIKVFVITCRRMVERI